ncbi:LmeA family phospholipid-binding protein [Streptomyces sp. GTA36]
MYRPHAEYRDDFDHRSDAARTHRLPLVIALTALCALIIVPVVVDRVAAARVESGTAEAFQEGMGTATRPEVHVRGFPVLTQVASGTLRHVDITARDIPADEAARPLPVTELDLRLDDLRKSDDGSAARARSAEATARLSYTDVSNALGLEVSQGDRPGRISARIAMPFGDGITVTVKVSAVSGNRIAFEDFRVTSGVLPDAGEALLDKVFEEPIQLRNIPDGLSLRSVTTTTDGLTAHFSGKSVTFRPDDAAQSGAAQGDSERGNQV